MKFIKFIQILVKYFIQNYIKIKMIENKKIYKYDSYEYRV